MPDYHYHPVCHLINGRRLYFLFISIKSSLGVARNEIAKSLEDKDSNGETDIKLDSQCSYFIIGETDILLKVWMSEGEKETLEKRLEDTASIDRFKTFLIRKTNTWYERKPSRLLTLDTTDIQAVMSETGIRSKDFPNAKLRISIPKAKTKTEDNPKLDSPYTVWVLIEYAYAYPESTFDKIEKCILEAEKKKKLKGIEFISFYRYYTTEKKGIIIKSNMDNLMECLGTMLSNVHENHDSNIEYGSTTYIAQHRIRKESHEWESNRQLDDKIKRRHSIYNLLVKHDCSKIIVAEQSIGRQIVEHFTDEVAEHFYTIFQCPNTEEWHTKIEQLRILFKWIVFGNNPRTKAFFQEYYADIEQDFSDVLDVFHVEIREDVNSFNACVKMLSAILGLDNEEIENALFKVHTKHKIFSEKITLGKIPLILKKFRTKAKSRAVGMENELDINLFNKAIDIISDMGKLRNPLVHGRISDIVRGRENRNGEETYYWRAYVSNFIKYEFEIKPNLGALKKQFKSYIAERNNVDSNEPEKIV